MKRLLIDASSVVKAALYAAVSHEHAYTVEFEGKTEIIPSHIDGYEIWLTSIKKTLQELKMVPAQVVFVKDGRGASALRREFLPEYRVRKPRPYEFQEEFEKCQQMAEDNLVSYGAIAVHKEGIEADDMIAALAKVTDCIIWSRDGDLSAAGDVYNNGTINPEKFLGIEKKHIVVYKALIGDTADKIPGCRGLGEKAFLDMITKYKDECLDELLEMFQNRTLHELEPYIEDFKPFKKIIDNAETVYASYQCAKFHHPGWHDIVWRAEYPKGDGTFPEWDLKIRLIEKKDLTDTFIKKFKAQLNQAPWGPSFDIETWSDEESLAWGIANKTNRGPRLDVFGAHMAGFSITTGPNNNLVYYFPVEHLNTDNLTLDDMKELLNYCNEDKPMFVFNAEFELPVVRKHMELRFDRGWLPNIHDVLIMKSYVNENTPLRLKFCSKEYLDYRQVTFEEVSENKFVPDFSDEEEVVEDVEEAPFRQMNTMTGEEVVAYGADDSICTMALANLFSLIMKYEETWNAYIQCELSPAYMCAEGFLCGQKFDLDMLEKLTEENTEKQLELRAKIDEKLIQIEWIEGDEIDGVTWRCKLPGCEFEPAYDSSPAEIKKVYQQVTGEPLKCAARSLPKLIAAMPDRELAGALEQGLEAYNLKAGSMFVPKPKLELGSPKQMCNLLYTAMGFPIRLRGKVTDKMREKGQKVGNPKGNESAIRHAIMYDASEEQKELLLLLIELKGLQTDRNLYLEPYTRMPNPKDGLVHGSYGQSRQKTRRFSSSNPNRTQLSTKSPIRKVYVPLFKDHVIVSFDEAGQELRHIAWHSQDPMMLSCFIGENKKDMHSITARAIMSLKEEDISYEGFIALLHSESEEDIKRAKKHRNPAKVLNFLDAYGGTAASLAEKLLIPLNEAEAILDAKHTEFFVTEQWKEKMFALHRERKYALTPLGARKHCVLDGSWKDDHELRSALNSIIQGGSAEQIKVAIAKAWDIKITDIFDCIWMFPCHDELVFSCRIDQVVEFCRTVHPIMTAKFANMDMPWESSIEIGWNYGELKEFSGFDEKAIAEYVEELRNGR